MKYRIDPLIAKRAPWLYQSGVLANMARRGLHRALSYEETVQIGTQLGRKSSLEIMKDMYGRLGKQVISQGLHNIPRQGPALIVANHPTGIADGVILHGLLAHIRPDTYFLANKDILRVMPQMSDMIAPVEWRYKKRTHGKTRETMTYMREAVAAGRLGLVFPSGRLAKRRGLQLHERPWMASAAMLARKFELPVIPVNICARNSILFYLLDILHPTLRDITLFHETLNKGSQPFTITMGEQISPSALPKSSQDAIALLRKATLSLGENGVDGVSLIKTSWAHS